MRILVTRPAEDAAPLVARLAEHGIEAALEPLLTIEILSGLPLDLSGVQALLVTSASGVRAFVARSPERMLPVFAVGDASAAVARALGFARVESAAGDVAALAALVERRVDPNLGALLHVAGTETAGDLGGALAAAGFAYRREPLYRATPAQSLSPATAELFRAGALAGVLLFSPRTAATFVRLARAAGVDRHLGSVGAYCLSAAVATEARALSWRRVAVAARPETEALIEALATTRA